jgi:hypothetical protein
MTPKERPDYTTTAYFRVDGEDVAHHQVNGKWVPADAPSGNHRNGVPLGQPKRDRRDTVIGVVIVAVVSAVLIAFVVWAFSTQPHSKQICADVPGTSSPVCVQVDDNGHPV